MKALSLLEEDPRLVSDKLPICAESCDSDCDSDCDTESDHGCDCYSGNG